MFDNFDFNFSELNNNLDSFNKKFTDIKNLNELSLEEILEENELIQELENQNQELINYFYNKTKIQQMLDYIIKEPPPDCDINRGYKFPFICSQIFNIENIKILDFFLKTNEELIPIIQQQKQTKKLFDEANLSKTEENVIYNDELNGCGYEEFDDKNIELDLKNYNIDEDQVNFGELDSSKKNTLDNEEDLVKIKKDDSPNNSEKNSNKIKNTFISPNKINNLNKQNEKNDEESDNEEIIINEDNNNNVNIANFEHYNENDLSKKSKINYDNYQIIKNKTDNTNTKMDNFITQKINVENKKDQKKLFEKILPKTGKKMKNNKLMLKVVEESNQNDNNNQSLKKK